MIKGFIERIGDQVFVIQPERIYEENTHLLLTVAYFQSKDPIDSPENYWIYHSSDLNEKEIFFKNMQYAWIVIRNDLSGGEEDEWDGEKYGTQIEQGDFIKLG